MECDDSSENEVCATMKETAGICASPDEDLKLSRVNNGDHDVDGSDVTLEDKAALNNCSESSVDGKAMPRESDEKVPHRDEEDEPKRKIENGDRVVKKVKLTKNDKAEKPTENEGTTPKCEEPSDITDTIIVLDEVSETEKGIDGTEKDKNDEGSENAEFGNESGAYDMHIMDSVGSEDEVDCRKDGNEEERKNETKTESKKSDAKKKKKTEKDADPNEKARKVEKEDKSSKEEQAEKSAKDEKTRREEKRSEEKELQKKEKHRQTLERYWKAVKDNPSDFTGWTYLLQYVDQQDDVESARIVYNDFLSRYPYCYGYWRKYADLLKRNGFSEECQAIFEKGIKAVPLSIDLWLHYINYCRSVNMEERLLRRMYARSIETCGKEFRSDRLWDCYIRFELESGNYRNATEIYDKWMSTPTQGTSSVFDRFKEYVSKNSPQKILSVEEFFSLRSEIVKERNDESSGIEDIDIKVSDDVPPGEETPEKLDQLNEDEMRLLKEKIIKSREKVHRETSKEVGKRWQYEDAIKRPYFHIKPLEASQLKNWRQYLEFEMKEGDRERILLLFERCMIACALYDDLWMEYLRYLEKQNDLVDRTRDAYKRACTIHHPTKLELHFRWAAFEEKHGNGKEAMNIIDNMLKQFPNQLDLVFRRINLARRCGSPPEDVKQLYQKFINENITNKESAVCLYTEFTNYCFLEINNFDEAVATLKAGIAKFKNELRLRNKLIDLYMANRPIDVVAVASLMDDVIKMNSISTEDKTAYSQRKFRFLECHAADSSLIQKAFDEYKELCKSLPPAKSNASDDKKSYSDGGMEGSSSRRSGSSQKSSSSALNFLSAPPPPPPPPDSGVSAYGAGMQSSNVPTVGPYAQPPPGYSGSAQASYGASMGAADYYANYGAYPANFGYSWQQYAQQTPHQQWPNQGYSSYPPYQ